MKLLVIEDEPVLLNNIHGYLAEDGNICETASNLATAREKIARHEYDCIILDIGLPDGSGVDLMRELDGRAMPSIALSGYGMDSDVRECLEAGFRSHVTKPVDWQRLSATIQQVTTER